MHIKMCAGAQLFVRFVRGYPSVVQSFLVCLFNGLDKAGQGAVDGGGNPQCLTFPYNGSVDERNLGEPLF